MHSNDYRNPDALPAGRVLVVGAGQLRLPDRQGALDHPPGGALTRGSRTRCCRSDRSAATSGGGPAVCGWTGSPPGSRLGRRLAGRDPVFGDGPRQLARRYGVATRPRVTAATGRTVTFQDGSSTEVDAVVWATGYRIDHSWIDVPGAVDDRGQTAAGPRRHPGARPVHPRSALAAHPRLRAAGLGRRGRGVHRRPHRAPPQRGPKQTANR